jgi:hypothetical protein
MCLSVLAFGSHSILNPPPRMVYLLPHVLLLVPPKLFFD